MISPPVIDTEKTVQLTMNPALLEEMQGLIEFDKKYDAILVDCTLDGFLFPAEDLVRACNRARELLTVKGSLIFFKPDQILVLVKETLFGDISFHVFDSLRQLYDFSSQLAERVKLPDSMLTGTATRGSDVSDQILMSTIAVLTDAGINSKTHDSAHTRAGMVLRAVDNYSTINTIANRVSTTDNMSLDELKDVLRHLEREKLIYPLFAKVPFLADCFRNSTLVTIKDYLLASNLLNKEQLDELLMERPSDNPDARLGLGPLCVSRGYFPSRQLEIILYDLAVYGGHSHGQINETANPVDQLLVQSLTGQLGNTDPAGLLQNLNSNRGSGVLTAEHRNLQFQCIYTEGNLTHARLGDILGNNALIEFVATWHEGMFAFMQRDPPPDLAADACKLTKPLDRLLLSAAMAHDHQEVLWKRLPHGIETAVEKLPDTNQILQSKDLTDPASGQPLTKRDLEIMQKLWQALDGLLPLSTVIRNLGNVTTTEAARALDLLLQMRLVTVPQSDVSATLEGFRRVSHAVSEHTGIDRNTAMLRLGLQSAHGYSTTSRIFIVGSLGEIGVDLGAAHSAGLVASDIVKGLDEWEVKYVECLCDIVDRALLKDIVYNVHGHKRPSHEVEGSGGSPIKL